MADSCSSSSDEDHAILPGALSVLQQIDDEENKETLKKPKGWFAEDSAAPAVRRISCSNEGH